MVIMVDLCAPAVDRVEYRMIDWLEHCLIAEPIFELFWDDEMIDVVVEGTNHYAEVKGAGKISVEGRVFGRLWKKVTEREIKLFLAILMYMGAKRGGGIGPGSFWN